MIRTLVRLKAPFFGGQAKAEFVPNFRRMKPKHRISFLNQCMKQMRAEYDLAVEHERIEAEAEDRANERMIGKAREA